MTPTHPPTHPHANLPIPPAGAVLLYIVHLPHLNAVVTLPPEDEVERLLLNPATLRSGVRILSRGCRENQPA